MEKSRKTSARNETATSTPERDGEKKTTCNDFKWCDQQNEIYDTNDRID